MSPRLAVLPKTPATRLANFRGLAPYLQTFLPATFKRSLSPLNARIQKCLAVTTLECAVTKKSGGRGNLFPRSPLVYPSDSSEDSRATASALPFSAPWHNL